MTVDIDQMPAGTELDILVAETLGYVEEDCRGGHEKDSAFVVANKVFSLNDGVYIKQTIRGNFVRFDPSVNIAAAWMVVQILNQQGYTLRLAGPEIPDTTGYLIEERWSAAFVEPQYAFTKVGQDQGKGFTPSLAICRAALKVMAEGQE